jgi:hypothetical protein
MVGTEHKDERNKRTAIRCRWLVNRSKDSIRESKCFLWNNNLYDPDVAGICVFGHQRPLSIPFLSNCLRAWLE